MAPVMSERKLVLKRTEAESLQIPAGSLADFYYSPTDRFWSRVWVTASTGYYHSTVLLALEQRITATTTRGL